jgi:hypothetical protein
MSSEAYGYAMEVLKVLNFYVKIGRFPIHQGSFFMF